MGVEGAPAKTVCVVVTASEFTGAKIRRAQDRCAATTRQPTIAGAAPNPPTLRRKDREHRAPHLRQSSSSTGLWLHASSWNPWLDLYRDAGYDPIAPGWPGEPATVTQARERPDLVANTSIDDAVSHFSEIVDSPPVETDPDRALLRRIAGREDAGHGPGGRGSRDRPGPDQGSAPASARATPLSAAGARQPRQPPPRLCP